LELRKADVYNTMVIKQKNIVVSGQTGEALLGQMINMTLSKDEKKK
jgi:hypothetical protein